MQKQRNHVSNQSSYLTHFSEERGYKGRKGRIKYRMWYIKNYILIILSSLAPFRLVTVVHRWRGVKIGDDVYISRGACIDHSAPQFIEIGNHVTIAYGAVILSHNREGRYDFSSVTRTKIGNRVFIGANAVILPGVTIGDGAIVGAGSVVTKDVSSNTLVFGVPARMIREIQIEK